MNTHLELQTKASELEIRQQLRQELAQADERYLKPDGPNNKTVGKRPTLNACFASTCSFSVRAENQDL